MNCRALYLWLMILNAAAVSASSCTFGKQTNRLLINVVQERAAAPFLNGYRKTVSGQVLAYHSSHPDGDSALLARANREAGAITWETDPMPAGIEGDSYQLVWLAGLEKAGWPGTEVHNFNFFVNGDLWFTFKNLKDESAGKWKVAGKHGAELSFEAVMADRAGDLFGYMFLEIPKSQVKPGLPLTLSVTGEDAGSLDWYMTLQYAFCFTPNLRAEPAMTKEGEQRKQYLRLSFDNLQAGRALQVSGEGIKPVRQPLNLGANILYLPVPAVDSEREIPVVFSINGAVAENASVKVMPVRQREVYLLSYSHNDIGYTDLQPAIEKKQWGNLEEALRLIKQTRNYPADARYKWNLEVMWPLEGYLAQASEQRRQEVVRAVHEGSLGLNALYANVLTGLANATEMGHFTEYARRFAEQNGIPISTALASDIPGFTWGIVPALARSGVKYFASAPNSGDRIGYVLREWGDKPFYWASQSGDEKVLMWVAGASYSSFHEGDLTRLGDEKILKMMRKLDERGYPYEIFQLPYTIGGDNGPPDPNLADFVKKWNERYTSPRLILATHRQMFEEFEKRYGASLPIYKGDFTPYWEDGAASSALETALTRSAVDRLVQGEALWAMLAPASYPEREYSLAWKNVMLWDEHTWGAHNSISAPDLPFVTGQWKNKRQFALDADQMSRALLARLRPLPARRPQNEIAVDVLNTTSWLRSDLVFLSPAESAVGDQVLDEKGNPVPSQRLSTGELAVLAENVPPLSARRFLVKPGKALSRGNCRASSGSLDNSLLSVVIDQKRGAILSLTWREKMIELVDRAKGSGLNQYLYVLGKDAAKAQPLSGVKTRVKENGSLVSSVLIEAEAPGCRKYSAEVRIVDSIARVEIINQIDKRAVRAKEAVHIAFPFHIPGGQIRYDVADGIVRPEADQLAGSCKNFFSLQNWVDISNGEYGVTWTSADAPLIEIGSITAEKPWMESVSSSVTIYSYVMNNYWHTNYKADQEGRTSFRYSIWPHAGFRPAMAVRLGREAREPLVPMIADPADQPLSSLLQIRPAEILLASLKPAAGGSAWLLCLYNPTSASLNAAIEWNPNLPVVMRQSDISGHPGPEIKGELKISAGGSAFVRAEKK